MKASGYDWKHKPHFPQTGDHPVVNITLKDASIFCEWLTKKEQASNAITDLQLYRLPTNKEWDVAVGLAKQTETLSSAEEAEQTQLFPWGKQWPPPPRAGNFNSYEIDGTDDGYAFTSPVGVFEPSPNGLHDLAGNVWEWAWDKEERVSAPGVLRGGSWMYFRKECLTSSYKYVVSADLRSPSIGFRYVLEDKHQTAVFLANLQRETAKEAQEQRNMLAQNPDVSAEEIAKMRQQLADRRSQSPEATPNELPDPASLMPAAAGQKFTSTIGMTFVPLEGSPLHFGQYEVRVQDYELAMKTLGQTWTRKPTFPILPSHPVINITWQEANAFAEWLTKRDREAGLISEKAVYRLPTDIEWSSAAGLKEEKGANPAEKNGANEEDFPWGRNQWPPPPFSANLDTARMSGYTDNFSYTAPAGSFSPNSADIYDLAGNVAEWCADAWPGGSGERVVRGSSWITSEKLDCLTSKRQQVRESESLPQIGFRLVLDQGQP